MFNNDPIKDEIFDNQVSIMVSSIPRCNKTHFSEIEIKMVHSYLGGGQLYQAHDAINFDNLNFMLLVARVNDYKFDLSGVRSW